jgi:endo-1,4-beta-xylanase
MKKKLVLSAMLVVTLALGLSLLGCPTDGGDDQLPSFVAVTSIGGVPTGGVKNTVVTLTGTVNPADATNKTIAWTVKTAGTTGATITDGNKLNTTASGTVEVTATITNGLTASSNFTQDFNIPITDSFIPVTSISGVPTSGTVGTALILSGTVNPNNATNQTIIWSVKSGSATINGNSLTASTSGEVVVTATITNGSTASSNFTQDLNIAFTGGGGGGFVAVTSISEVPNNGGVGTHILTGTVNPSNATNQTIVWSVRMSGGTGASTSGNTLNTTSSGTVVVTATIVNGLAESSNFTQDFPITITVGGVSGIDKWSTLLGEWEWREGPEDNVQLEFITDTVMGGHIFYLGYLIDGGGGGGSVFSCSYIGTTFRRYSSSTNTTDQTFTVIVSSDGQTLTISDYQNYTSEPSSLSYMDGKTYTKLP